MSTLYVNDNEAIISVEGGYFRIDKSDGMEHKIPKETLDAITLFGNSAITVPCMKECLKMGIPVNLFSGRGSYFGKLTSTRHSNAQRLKKQVYAADNNDFCINMAKKIIDAKINNQIVVLRRYNRTNQVDIDNDIKSILPIKNKILTCETVEEIMGYEGIAARYYFSALSKLVDEKFAFNGRSKQPPKDAFNSMLSLGYTILLYKIYAEIENRGLSPYIGLLHSDNVGHPALASDMMEEWRAAIVDSTVMSLVQGHEILPEYFDMDEGTGGIIIKSAGMKIFLNKLETKFNMHSKYVSDEKCSMNYAIYMQTVAMLRAMEKQNRDMYAPLRIR